MLNPMMRSSLHDPDPNPAGGNGASPSQSPAGGNQNPGASNGTPDFAAFETKLLDTFSKGINGIEKRMEAKFKAMFQPVQSNSPTPSGEPPEAPLPNGAPLDLVAKQLQIDLNKERAAREQDKKERVALQQEMVEAQDARMKAEQSQIASSSIAGINFVDPQAAQHALSVLTPRTRYSKELGRWVGEDDVTPAGDWIKTQVLATKYWLAPVTTSPAGARPGTILSSPNDNEMRAQLAIYHSLPQDKKDAVDRWMKTRTIPNFVSAGGIQLG